ncbi:MAG: NAD(P)H-dependent oxidoreductase [Methanoregula sp.]|jgi:nitroreductase
MDFKDIVMARYATKQFDGTMISEPQLFQLLDIIRFAPSAFNLQPWKIKIITAAKIKEKLKVHSNNQPQIMSCSHLLVLCANTELELLVNHVEQRLESSGMPDEARNQYIGMIREYIGAMNPERRLSFAREQVFIALANAVNGAKALGFDSCPMGGFDPAAYSETLYIPDEYVPTVLCAIGYTADTPAPKWRFPREDIFF